jgi:hypothetical protein
VKALVSVLVLALGAAAADTLSGEESGSRPPGGPPAPDRGLALGIFSRGTEAHLRPAVRELASLGIDSVSLVVPVVVRDIRSVDFYAEPSVTPADEALRRAARLAHAAGLRVLLFPIIHVWELEEGEWRGKLEPPDWQIWFERYGEVILRYAALAREEGIEALSVGSELCSSEHREREWRTLIGKLRETYPGWLTYSANWDHRRTARFLDALDFVSMNAYYRLADDGEATLSDLESAWEPIVRDVDRWAAGLNKPLVISEIGYPSRDGAARDPWDYTVQASPDPLEQALLYEAFLRSWARARTLAGVYFYLWWGEGGAQDTGYTPRGKKAEEVLRAWLRGEMPGTWGTMP